MRGAFFSLVKCSRCGKSHKTLLKPFKRKPSEFTHFGTCPNTNEPILANVVCVG